MAGQGSARVTLKEIDLSQVRDPEQLPQGVPAAVVGPAKRGPAFVPMTFANMQQFGEVFGSMNEVSKESNANRFAPLALNEWMRNAQAGTFIRTLGIGSAEGRMNSDRTVDGAGFVLGSDISYDINNKLQRNQHAEITDANEVGSKAAARTHFLGCFMKDQGDSTFLQDANIQTAQAAGSINISILEDSAIKDASTLKITYYQADKTEQHVTFTFDDAHAAEGGGGNATIHSDGTPTVVLQDLADAINSGIVTGNDGIVLSTDLIATLDADTDVLNIRSKHAALADFSNNIKVEYDIESDQATTDIIVGDKNASDGSQSVSFGSSGNRAARFSLRPRTDSNPLTDADTVSFSLINNDGDGTLSDKTVTYTFKQTLTDNGINTVEDKYSVNNADAVEIFVANDDKTTFEGKRQALINLQAALNRVATVVDGVAQTATNHEGLSTTSFDYETAELTIFQKNKGCAGNSESDETSNISIVSDVFRMTAATDLVRAKSGSTTVFTAGGQRFMHSGFDSEEKKSMTIKLSDNALNDDSINISVQKFDDVDGVHTLHLVFKDTVDNTATNGSAAGPYQVQIGVDLQETLYNLRNAILVAHAGDVGAADISDDVDVVVSDANDSITLTYKNNGAANDNDSAAILQGTLRGDVASESKLGEYATFTNPSGFSLVGNVGLKTVNFSGGGGAAAPVIRGILMTPQGVVPALDLSTTHPLKINYEDDLSTFTPSEVGLGNSVKAFGNGQSVWGYEIGKVDLTTQSFKLILNGYNGSDANILDCSFDPENVNYFANVLNTDPDQIEDRGHYLFAYWDIDPSVAKVDVTGVLNRQNAAIDEHSVGFCMSASSALGADAPQFEKFDTRFRTACSPWIRSQSFGSDSYDLFKLHALDDGEVGNSRFRVLVSNIVAPLNEGDWGTFDLTLEDFHSDPIKGSALIGWKRLSLDPESRNFIGRVIGDKHMYYDFDRVTSRQRLVEEGNFDVKNKYVRVELSELVKSGEVNKSSLPCGFSDLTMPNTAISNLFNEPGDDNSLNHLLAADIFDGLKVLPLPLVKTITRSSGDAFEASESLSWGVKFARKKISAGSTYKHSELSEIRFNDSLKSWTKFYPDMTDAPIGVVTGESFSLEHIAVDDPSNINWGTSEYIRGGNSGDLPLTDDIADGGTVKKQFISLSTASSIGRNTRYLKFRFMMQGGFDGLDIFNKEKAEMSTIAAHREANDETDSNIFTGATVESYKRAIDVLADKSATELQLLAIPGIREPVVTDYATVACESRFDAMLVMDVEEVDRQAAVIVDDSIKPSVTQTIQRFEQRRLNTSFAAAYFPDIIMRRPSNGAPLQVPPSVSMLGVMSQNDTLADPWFAPAGLTRGRLNALSSKVQMNRDVLNDLYDQDINPIYEPAGRAGEVYAFGQKTLLQNQSALDRINVRRLLINLRRKVKAVANTLLFEPNRASTLARFSSLVEPIMAEVQARQGVERYKVQIDTSTTTQNDVENNTVRGKIYLQPTKSVEFISLDFVVTNSID